MKTTFFFYDLETSGLNPRSARIMQFAGQRTDSDLRPIGDPVNILIKLTSDILPDPRAILLTGITPQQTLKTGITEAEFLKIFHEQVSLPGTIFIGYNTIRFDDEFMRFLNYRNFYDPYQWQWQDGRSRWDLLDVVRMTRALRPEGIIWSNDKTGKATNRLEDLTSANNIPHSNAHDALADVKATIAVAKLIHDKQPKLFDYLLKMRQKKNISELVLSKKPFIYTSGKYSGDYLKTTVVKLLVPHPQRDGALVYDLRYDPTPFSKLSVKQLVAAWKYDPDKSKPRLPIKTLQYNRCPAVAPISVLDDESRQRLGIDLSQITENEQRLAATTDWPAKILEALAVMDSIQEYNYGARDHDVNESLYDGFFGSSDNKLAVKVHEASGGQLRDLKPVFKDSRLSGLLPLYQARNFPDSLSDAETESWNRYRLAKLTDGETESQLAKFESEISDLIKSKRLSKKEIEIINQLKLYETSIIS
jgi:exodeoxyribonuclease-1